MAYTICNPTSRITNYSHIQGNREFFRVKPSLYLIDDLTVLQSHSNSLVRVHKYLTRLSRCLLQLTLNQLAPTTMGARIKP